MDPETLTLLLSFIFAGILHKAIRVWPITILVPPLVTFFVLGHIESNRPYSGGGASFYIIGQVALTMFAAGLSAAAALLVEKYFPGPPH